MEPAHCLDPGRAQNRRTHPQDAEVFVFLCEHRHELLDAADVQHLLAQSYSPELGGQEPVEAALLALATLLQAYGNVSDRAAVELTVMDKRWQMVLDCLRAEQPPFSQGTLGLVLEEVAQWLEQRHTLAVQAPPRLRRSWTP